MTSNQIVLRVADTLDRLAIPYMLVGSYSSNLHGIPRSTNDADFVIELPASGAPVSQISAALGPDFTIDPLLLFETVTANYRYIINHPNSGFKVELFLLSNDPHHLQRFQRRIRRPLEGRDVWFQTAEDVIIQKLKWYARIRRSKDIEDIADVIDTQAEVLDLSYIRHWTDQHGTRDLFEQLLASAQPPDSKIPSA